MNGTNVFLIILLADLYFLLVKIWFKILHYQIINVKIKAIHLDCFELTFRETVPGSSFGQVYFL
jgi:hypothetical protein